VNGIAWPQKLAQLVHNRQDQAMSDDSDVLLVMLIIVVALFLLTAAHAVALICYALATRPATPNPESYASSRVTTQEKVDCELGDSPSNFEPGYVFEEADIKAAAESQHQWPRAPVEEDVSLPSGPNMVIPRHPDVETNSSPPSAPNAENTDVSWDHPKLPDKTQIEPTSNSDVLGIEPLTASRPDEQNGYGCCVPQNPLTSQTNTYVHQDISAAKKGEAEETILPFTIPVRSWILCCTNDPCCRRPGNQLVLIDSPTDC